MLIFSVGITFTLTLFWIFKFYLKKYLTVQPSLRGAHSLPVPQGGGILFTIASFFHFDLFGFKLLAFIPLLIISFIDDLINLPWKIRLATQLFTSTILIATFLHKIPNNTILTALIAFILIFTTVSIINISNFMDGLDGLVSGCMFLIMITLALDSRLNINLFLGALFGFIIINWHPAKVFMGDIGSNFLGYFVIVLILENNEFEKIIAGLTLLSPLIFDSGICLINRILNEENLLEIFKPHKQHLYQKMYQAGISQYKVSLIYIFSTLYLCISYSFFYSKELLLVNTLFIFLSVFILSRKYSLLLNKNVKF